MANKSENLRRIKKYLKSEGFARIGDLVQITSVTKSTVSKYLKELGVKKIPDLERDLRGFVYVLA